ncbi:hypothetical protein J2S22_004393 [Rhodoplanes tepidamans]|nr:hypothetical protein [Rhodoplanes tepidamans]
MRMAAQTWIRENCSVWWREFPNYRKHLRKQLNPNGGSDR